MFRIIRKRNSNTHILLSTGVWKGISRNCASPYPVWFELIDNVILANKVPDAANARHAQDNKYISALDVL